MLNRILYYVVLKPLSFLPLRVLYVVSDLLFLVLYRGIGYRRKIIRGNLTNSFKAKSVSEINEIERKFYHHFCDLVMESVRLFSISEKELKMRCRFANPEVLDKLFAEGKSVILVAGHYNNWEMTAAIMGSQLRHEVIGIYTPVRNAFFDRKLLQSRERFGLRMVSRERIKEEFGRQKPAPTVTLFATDQSPTFSKKVHWTKFLDQPTAIFLGAERYARQFDYPLVFGYIKKVKRGFYETTVVVLDDHPAQSGEGVLSEAHTRFLERQIEELPQYWLWSHKRWKRKMTEEDQLFQIS